MEIHVRMFRFLVRTEGSKKRSSFYILGSVTMAWSVVVFFLLPDSPVRVSNLLFYFMISSLS